MVHYPMNTYETIVQKAADSAFKQKTMNLQKDKGTEFKWTHQHKEPALKRIL